MKKYQALLAITSLLFSLLAFAEPILVFKPNESHLLIGVNDVVLNGESYDVQFGPGIATIFADQQAAFAASNALVDQVFSSSSFLSLNINRVDPNLPGTWLGKSVLESGKYLQVAQLWGEKVYGCAAGVTPPSNLCQISMNQSIISLSATDGPSTITNKVAYVGYLNFCGDCGAMETLWIKRNVVEPGPLYLLAISLVGLCLARTRRRG